MGIVLDLSQMQISAAQIYGQLTNTQILSLDGSKLTGSVAASLLTGTVSASIIDSAIARLASPALTGSPTAPTPSTGSQSTAIATTAYVDPAHTFSTKGGQKLGSGLIMNWGQIVVGDHGGGGFGGGTGSDTWYYSYPTAVLGLIGCIYDANATASIILSLHSATTSGFSYATSEMAGITQDYSVLYFSVGY